ncbi:MAG TPA: ClpXP protease specificity-enhancing factor [Candidatus Binatia bacterium]|nr:ClpXP protease specificity-enhancing factor [Candidatus Binatia bacterium]
MPRSRRPYLIRAVYDWAADNGYTPHLLIAADAEGVAVPREFVKEGRITLNISPMAVQNLDLQRDPIRFFARFSGHPFEVQVPSGAVLAVFARENGEGIVFGEVEPPDPASGAGTPGPSAPKRPKLRVVK